MKTSYINTMVKTPIVREPLLPDHFDVERRMDSWAEKAVEKMGLAFAFGAGWALVEMVTRSFLHL